MSSILELPSRGSDITITITRVHSHPTCELVEFWGKVSQERTEDYQLIAKAIQSPGNSFKDNEGNPGDQCLVLVDDTWYRSRLVSRNGSKYTVFLIDKGRTHSTTTSMLAWGKKEHYHLPPEVEFCVLANVVPLPPDNRWSPVTFEFLKSLTGQSVKARVQDVIVPHRTFVVHIPWLSQQMYEMGFAKKLHSEMFLDFLLKSLQTQTDAEISPMLQYISVGEVERLQKQELYMYPELLTGIAVSLLVTEVTNPQRIFCQLKVFSQELTKLSEQLTQYYEGRVTSCIVSPEMIGFPCAARGVDGRWYRSVLQQVFPTNKVVEVLNVDYGTKQFVQVDNVRPLATEFFRMPVVTYICALHGIIDKGVGWTSTQIEYLKSLLLHKTVIAKLEYQSISEGVYYVTLYGDEDVNINTMFGSKENCLLECEKTLVDYMLQSMTSDKYLCPLNEPSKEVLPSGQAVEDREGKENAKTFPDEDLLLNTSQVVFVQHISNPSEFWIQTTNSANALEELMESMYNLYKDSKNDMRNPTIGLYCAAKARDGDFYRAVVSEVCETEIKVFFVDYGDTCEVDWSDIRTLPERFKKLPWLSHKCTLAGVRPKDFDWSPDATEFFIKAATEKPLNMHVTAKYNETNIVQLTDPELQGEGDLSSLMCDSNFAEWDETHKQPKAKMTLQPAIISAKHHPGARSSGVYSKYQKPYKNSAGPCTSQGKNSAFKELMFPIGSVLDVSVSHVASPNDFWCQVVQSAGHLKMLMHDIQAHYACSEFQPIEEPTCVARHPSNGLWYRALVVHKYETPYADVLFVDYGQRETMSLYDLRRMHPEFLTLPGQAFRCSLLNPINPSSPINDWNDEAVAKFHNFVKTASSNFVTLKCTIYAITYSEQQIVFNIVDVETPFESVCTSIANLAKTVPAKKVSGQSVRLATYCYSTHSIKTGTEEYVTVTCVKDVHHFYCQLERNVDVTKDLKMKVNNLCHELENVQLPAVFGTLCFAKYIDGNWYRAQIKTTKPSIVVHFVDYGDTLEIDKSNLLPIPTEASDIMSVPVQAVVCGLADVPTDVPREVDRWFETSATECKFRALVVARDLNGNLLVELYHGHRQINSRINKMLQTAIHSEELVVHQSQKRLDTSTYAQKTSMALPKVAVREKHIKAIKNNLQVCSKPTCKTQAEKKPTDVTLQSALPVKPLCRTGDNSKRVKRSALELYIPLHQRQTSKKTVINVGNGFEANNANIAPKKATHPTDTEESELKSLGIECQIESTIMSQGKMETLTDLPIRLITVGMEADIHISHSNSSSSFYVQLVRDKDEIRSLVKKLNDSPSAAQILNLEVLHPGDLIQAQCADDCLWHRAVVRELRSKDIALIEFVDLGNTAEMPISKMARLPYSVMQLPVYCTHCSLSEAADIGIEQMLDPKVASAFKKEGHGDKVLKCHFNNQLGSVWEVNLEDNGGTVTCKVPTICTAGTSDVSMENSEHVMEKPEQPSDRTQLNICRLHFHHQDLQEGQQLDVYITTVNGDNTFWCQSADAEELDMTSFLETEYAVDHKQFNADSLSPGSPCIALFDEDQCWYRAEVLDKDGEHLSVLFVDYGNKCQVKGTDVKEISHKLLETPMQSFLCKLEGFDDSEGSWDSDAVDTFKAFTADRLLQLTVTKTIRENGWIKCFVLLECDGQVLNESLRTHWRSCIPENQAVKVKGESKGKETAQPEGQRGKSECPQILGTDIALACFHPEKDPNEEKSGDHHSDFHAMEEALLLATRPEKRESFDKTLYPKCFAESPQKERYQECSFTSEPQTSQTEPFSALEDVKIDLIVTLQTSDNALPEIGFDDILLSPAIDKDDQSHLTFSQITDRTVVVTDKGSCLNDASVMDGNWPEKSNAPSSDQILQELDKYGIPSTGLLLPCKEVHTPDMSGSSDLNYTGKQNIHCACCHCLCWAVYETLIVIIFSFFDFQIQKQGTAVLFL